MTAAAAQRAKLSEQKLPGRVRRLIAKPWAEKVASLRLHGKRLWDDAVSLPSRLPRLVKMPAGYSWIAWNDHLRDEVLNGNFEPAEQRFVERFLKSGMTVLDIGAYYGLYTLIASGKVGRHGTVIAFEPSPSQMRRLKWNLRMNFCRNVRTEQVALGNSHGVSNFFLVQGGMPALSSLCRPLSYGAAVRQIRVRVTSLDTYLQHQLFVSVIDFMKVDVEGGELGLFEGARNLLIREPRPVILCELEDVRTQSWGYHANDAAEFLHALRFRWFLPNRDGSLRRIEDGHQFNGNYVAIPEERMEETVALVE
jgi:FkbM family methyltransferase